MASMPKDDSNLLRTFFDRLFSAFGPQHWWPGRTRVEIIVGAVLTQNTSWTNVERAIRALRAARLLSWRALRDVPVDVLAEHIRPAGYYRVKARRLKNLLEWHWGTYRGSWAALRDVPTERLRAELLSVNGVGPETADAILLYALHRPTFVVDAYTGRVLRRHGVIGPRDDYGAIKQRMESDLPAELKLYNEYHALLVEAGKRHCRPTARCAGCPLEFHPHDVGLS